MDLTNVKRCAIDDDSFSFDTSSEETTADDAAPATAQPQDVDTLTKIPDNHVNAPTFNMARRLSRNWTSGAGPRIGCVRDYPTELQFRALEQVNLSPRVASGPAFGNYGPIPSPRPSPKVRMSPRLAYMGLPSPRTPIASN